MSAGDMAAGKNHHHERRADCEWGDHPRTCPNHGAANRQDKEECSDEFGDILVHNLQSYRRQLEKSKPQPQLNFGLTAAVKLRTWNGKLQRGIGGVVSLSFRTQVSNANALLRPPILSR